MSTKTINASLSTSKAERFEVLDVAKGLGMFFVVFAHVNYTPFLLSYIYSFHMPLFFIISGMLFNRDKYSDFSSFIKRRVKTLIVPYIIFYIASIVIMFLLNAVSKGISAELFKDCFDHFMQMFLSQGSSKVFNAPLWFVPCLFAVEIMYYFISKLCNGKSNLYIVLICSILASFGWLLESGYLPFNNKILPWSLDSAMFALGFYALGNLMYGNVKSILHKIDNNKYRILIAISSLILCIILLVPLVYLNGKISLGSKVLNNGFLVYLSGIIGTIGILSASVLFKKSKLLKLCGLNSFYIMSTHYVIRIIYQTCYSFLGITMYNNKDFWQTIIPFVVIMTASIIFAVVLNKVKKYNFKLIRYL